MSPRATHPFFEFGGPPVKVRALSEGLASRGHAITVLTADWGLDQPPQRLPVRSTRRSTPLWPESARPVASPQFIWPIGCTIAPQAGIRPRPVFCARDCGNFDVVHIFGLYDLLGPRVAAACREAKIPYVVEPIGMFVPLVRNFWLKRMYHRVYGSEMLFRSKCDHRHRRTGTIRAIAGGIPRRKDCSEAQWRGWPCGHARARPLSRKTGHSRRSETSPVPWTSFGKEKSATPPASFRKSRRLRNFRPASRASRLCGPG